MLKKKKKRQRCLFYLQALSAKGWSPKGRRGKENTSPVKQQVGLRTWDILVHGQML